MSDHSSGSDRFRSVELTLSDFITSNAEAHAERAALVASDSSLTWLEFDRRTRQVAQALRGAGLSLGDRVVIVMANGFAMAEAMFGVMRAGMIVVPLNTTVSDETLHLLLTDADPALVIATAEHTSRLEGTPSTVRRIVAGGPVSGWTDFEEWRDAASAEPPPALAANEPCNIIYSSGTTGAPKGIVHTHRGRLDWAYDLALAMRYGDGARSLIATGLYSNISWATLLSTILCGGTTFIHSVFEPGAVLKTIASEGITNLSMVPLQLQKLVDHPDFSTTDKSSLQGVMSVGSPLPAKVKEQLLSDLPCGVLDAWGLTEGIITVLPPEQARDRLASVGQPVQGSRIQLISDDGVPVAGGEAGEVVGLSRFVMSGYWNNPAATRAAMWADAEGRQWLRTGDIGRLDEEGFLYIVDRKKDMILSGAQNVYPADLEAVLFRHSEVQECAVVGIPDDKWGEVPLAIVVQTPGAQGSVEGIREWANERLGRQQRIARLTLSAALPRNANGKVLKNELRDAFLQSINDVSRSPADV